MNTYTFEELDIGMSEQFTELITKEKHRAFTALSGDINPMHMDENFAKENGFNGRLVYGMLQAALLSKLVGVYLPGKWCLFQSIDAIYFKKPVYLGDKLTITGTIISKGGGVSNSINIKVDIRNQNSDKVALGKLTVGVMR